MEIPDYRALETGFKIMLEWQIIKIPYKLAEDMVRERYAGWLDLIYIMMIPEEGGI